MPGSFVCLHYHIVFGTRDRQPLIAPGLAGPLYAYMAGVIKGLGGTAVLIGGTADHVHLLVGLRQDRSLADVVREIKTGSSRWVHETCPECRTFAWQEGYGAFTTSFAGAERVKAYIAAQEEHHRELSFRDEFLSFLTRHHIDFDERHLWG